MSSRVPMGDFTPPSSRRSKTNRKIKRLVTNNSKTSRVSSALVTVNNKVNRLKAQVRNQSEYRYNDTFLNGTVSTTGTIVLLNGMTLGDTNGTREGTDAMMKHIRVKMTLIAADATQLMRVMLIWDKQTNAATPLITDVLDTSTSPATLAFLNDSNKERFSILSDRLYSFVVGGDTNQRIVKINRRMNSKTNYDTVASTGFVGIKRGALFLLLVSDSSASTHPGANISARLRYVA